LRVAVLADIHGNLPALEAVVADLDERDADEVWCGGDIAWGGPWASECVARVREFGWPTVKGNTDVWVTGDPQTIESDDERRRMVEIAEAHGIDDDDAQWLVGLPIGHSGPGSVLLVHGTPESPFMGPEPDDSPSDFSPYKGHASLVVFAHVHKAFLRRLEEGTLVCNSGSVGAAKDGMDACYLLMDLDGPTITLRHRRVPYDRDKAVRHAQSVGGPVGDMLLSNIGADR
jgi:predicted phosphodiesterase